MSQDHASCLIETRTCWLDEEMAELSLLLSAGQAAKMEKLAHSQGLTLGRLIRLLICDYLTDRVQYGPVSKQPVGKPCDTSAFRFDAQDASP